MGNAKATLSGNAALVNPAVGGDAAASEIALPTEVIYAIHQNFRQLAHDAASRDIQRIEQRRRFLSQRTPHHV